MIELGIDEFTVVLQLSKLKIDMLGIYDWQDVAKKIIRRFEDVADLQNIFGARINIDKVPQGYNYGYSFGEHDFFFVMAYHEVRSDMGVLVKFSAQALDYYCDKTGLKPYEALQNFRDELYSVRLSRVDFTADYFDEEINITNIYNDLMHHKIGVFRESKNKTNGKLEYRRIDLNLRGYIKESEVPTIYIGSGQSNSMMRIYDKRLEQIEKKGTKYDRAIKCKNWTRFEAVFRNEYAHQLSEALMNIKNDIEYTNLIACTIIQKYNFMIMDNGNIEETDFSQMLIDCIADGSFALRSPTSRQYDLLKSIIYLWRGSGLITTLFKIKTVWGDDSILQFFDMTLNELDEYCPNDDCLIWIRRNKDDYRNNYDDFKTFIKTTNEEGSDEV